MKKRKHLVKPMDIRYHNKAQFAHLMRAWRNLADAPGLGPGGQPCRFKSCRPHFVMTESNNKLIEYKDTPERVILVGIDPQASPNGSEAENSLEELAELVQTAGAEVVFYVMQFRDKPHPGTYVGSGKVEEIKELIREQDATGIVCDDELSPVQMQNLTDALEVKVMDRTMVILDIFARHAASREGKLQVELAQLKYTASHLSGMRRYLSRQGGGIGTRGPGEKKLEMDRRIIGKRITTLKNEIREMENNRQLQRKKRSSSDIPVGAIVGYTNAGKSTLLNRLTNANVLEEDKLFATLDPTTRNLELTNGQQVLLTDTVGFVRKLPHHLIDAFRSTLEEARYADFLIHVIDASDPQMERQMEITYRTLTDLDITNKPIITIFNKMDLLDPDWISKEKDINTASNKGSLNAQSVDKPLSDAHAKEVIRTSVISEEARTEIIAAIERLLRQDKVYVERLYSYADAGQIQMIRKYGELISERYTENGIYVEAYIPRKML